MKKKVLLIFLLCFALIFTACGQKPEQVGDNAQNQKQTQEKGYPVTILNYDGYIETNKGAIIEQTYDKAPERIVSISQAVTELLITLGLEDKIVGTAHRHSPVYEPYAEKYNKIPFMVEGNSYPSKEVMISYEPDIIIGWGSLFDKDSMGSVTEWHEKGIHTYIMNNTVPDLGNRQVSWILDDIEKLGKIFNIEKKADSVIKDIKERLEKIEKETKKIKEEDKPRVLTVQYMYENEFMGRASTDLTTDIINLAGGIPLDDVGGKQSLEIFIDKNPDIILVINLLNSPASGTIEAMKNHDSLKNLDAVKNDRFLIIEHTAFYCGSIRTVEAIEELSKIMK